MATKTNLPIDDYESVPQDQWVQVSVPREGPYGDALLHSYSINNHEYIPGKAYWLPPGYAETLKERIAAYNRSEIRRLQPRKDIDALRQASGAPNSSAASVIE